MKKFITFSVIAILVALLSSCSNDYKSQLLGAWEADQASQAAGSNELLSHYNYLEVSSSNINLKSYFLNEKSEKSFDELEKNLAYEWKSKHQIMIDKQPYEIEVKRRELVIKNDKIEIHYIKN